jgi:hypothetical protein|tara:strand:+ start:358 stop:900 length:543 start_codon:yes stop_codon:yes gene_type:complete
MASELHVDAIKHSGGTSALTIDSSGNIVTNAKLRSTGHVIQTVVGSTSNNNTGSATFSSIGSGTITPVATSSKILLIAQMHVYVRGYATNSWRAGLIRFKRGSTAIFGDIGTDPYGSGGHFDNDNDRYMEYSTRVYLDSPSTTSAVTYTIEGASRGGLINVDFNSGAYGSSSFYLQEIAG